MDPEIKVKMEENLSCGTPNGTWYSLLFLQKE